MLRSETLRGAAPRFHLLLALLSPFAAIPAQSSRDVAVELAATVTSSPPTITLNWSYDATATAYAVMRRLPGAASWSGPTAIAIPATSYVDTNVVAGQRYEYYVLKYGSPAARGFLTAGIEAPAIDDRGAVVLLVDATMAPQLGSRLDRLVEDLTGDGWHVLRHDVPTGETPPLVRARIQNENTMHPGRVKCVFVLGHVAVPYSGLINPDGHPDHLGAWPADVYYGDVDGVWTDVTANSTVASRAENRNVPGDGKFDQSVIPSNIDLAVGRVDLANMPSFALPETALLQQYLDKDHDYRHKVFAPAHRAIVDDNFGYFSGEAFAASGWRAFAALVGSANATVADYFTTLNTPSGSGWLWSYGCGGGSYQSAGGIGTTTDFTLSQNRTVFTMLFGSYFGDWDCTDNFLRAPLCQGWTLTNVWAGRPHWSFHPMTLGATIGDCALYSQNDMSAGGYGGRWVHVALMGDPTLREHVIAPPGAVTIVDQWPQAALAWTASADAVAGYHVYRASSPQGPFTRLTAAPVAATAFVDAAAVAGASTYMVRALRLEATPGGSYWNLSQGTFATAMLPQRAAANIAYGDGCYRVSDSFHQTFADAAAAATALAGTAFTLSPQNGGYAVTAGGAAFVPPSPAATPLPLGDEDAVAIALSQPFAAPGGATTTLHVHANGIVSTSPLQLAGPALATPAAAAMLAEAATAFWCWHDYDPTEPGSGPVRAEESAGTLYVTWDGVESKPAGIASPSTLQLQFELATGVVHCVFVAIAATGDGAHLIGFSPGGPSVDGGEVDLAASLPFAIGTQNLEPLELSATPAPVVTATTGVLLTYAVDHAPALSPGNHLGFVVFALDADVGGNELGGIGMPGCRQFLASPIASLLFLGATPQATVALPLPAGFPAGISVYAQAIALSPPNGLPNGQNALGAVTSNGVQSFVNDH